MKRMGPEQRERLRGILVNVVQHFKEDADAAKQQLHSLVPELDLMPEAQPLLADAFDSLGMRAETQRRIERHLELLQRFGGTPAELADAGFNKARFLLSNRTSNREELVAVLRAVRQHNPRHHDAGHWLAHQVGRASTPVSCMVCVVNAR